jgi:hypothetical protein
MLTALLLLTACEQNSGKSSEVLGSTAALSPIEKTCKRAWTGRDGARDKVMKAMTPEQQAGVPEMPDKKEFIAACSKLPEDAAKCLDPNWFTVDAEACVKALEAADKDAVEAINKLLQGLPAEDEKEEEAGEEGGEEGKEGDAAPTEGAGDLVEQALKQGG